MAVVAINAWNRIGVSANMEFEIKKETSFPESNLTPAN
jgi:hypothetical protein